LQRRFAVADGDVLILIADPSYAVVTSALGQLRLHLRPSGAHCRKSF
jgi:aspartyl-tRNA synthetase